MSDLLWTPKNKDFIREFKAILYESINKLKEEYEEWKKDFLKESDRLENEE